MNPLYLKLVDFGLVILIWMTQLIVYPGFTYYSEADLLRWHPQYTTAISIIVMPLMLLQVGLYSYDLLVDFKWLSLVAAVLIGLAWVNTFFFAVPLHGKIGVGKEVMEAAGALVSVNWYRTVLWTIVFLLGFFR